MILTVDLPALDDRQVTATGDAEIGQPFTWTRHGDATPRPRPWRNDVDVVDVLPPELALRAEQRDLTGIGQVEPAISPSLLELTWADLTDLDPGESVTITFDAVPLEAAAAARRPHVNVATVTGDDASGADESGDGPYSDTDDAATTLLVPELAVDQAPDNGVAAAGDDAQWTIEIENTGTGTARDVEVTDTLPPGRDLHAGHGDGGPARRASARRAPPAHRSPGRSRPSRPATP